MANKVIYHKNCYDGITAAYVAWLKFGENATYIPLSYGDPIPDVSAEDEIYMVDFSLPRETLEQWHHTVKKLQVLDHHHTARQALEGLPYCEFDMNRSGAGMTWDYFFPDKPRHLVAGTRLIDYVEDRDLWRFALPHSKEIHAWYSSFRVLGEGTFATIHTCVARLEDSFQDCVTMGEAILRFSDQKVEEVISYGTQWRDVGGYKIPCVNCPYHMGSDVGHRLLEIYPDAPFAGYFLMKQNGDEQWGLRGRDSDEFDVSAVAKGYGGGGHKKASGFLMNRGSLNASL